MNVKKFLRTIDLTVGVIVRFTVLRGVVVQGSVDVVHHAVQMLREAAQFSLLKLRERTILLLREHRTRVWKQKIFITGREQLIRARLIRSST